MATLIYSPTNCVLRFPFLHLLAILVVEGPEVRDRHVTCRAPKHSHTHTDGAAPPGATHQPSAVFSRVGLPSRWAKRAVTLGDPEAVPVTTCQALASSFSPVLLQQIEDSA